MDWKQLLNLERHEMVGLDIGSSAVKAVQLRKTNSDWAVTAAGMIEIAAEDENSLGDKETSTVRAIRDCLSATGATTQWAVCGVCGPEVAVRCFKFPLLPTEEIASAVRLEAEQVCGFNVKDGVVDYQLIPNDNDKDNVRGVLVAATNKLVKGKSSLATSARLSNVLMDVDGLALLNCLSGYEKSEDGAAMAVLNIGSAYTNLAIVGDSNLPFIRDMAYGGDDITNTIATESGLQTDIVSKILAGSEDPSKHQLELYDSLKSACQKLIVDVTGTLRYYTAEEKSAVVETIFVCGGFALVEGFVQLLDNQLPGTVVLWNPFEKMRCLGGQQCEDILHKSGPAMAMAAGLAMRSI